MKLNNFVIIVQWGAGMRYISGTCESEESAQLLANSTYNFINNNHKTKRGARPEVSVWERKSTGPIFVESKV